MVRDQLKKVFIGSNHDDDFDDKEMSLHNENKVDFRSKSVTKKVYHNVRFHKHDVLNDGEEDMPDEASVSA